MGVREGPWLGLPGPAAFPTHQPPGYQQGFLVFLELRGQQGPYALNGKDSINLAEIKLEKMDLGENIHSPIISQVPTVCQELTVLDIGATMGN